MRSRTKYFGHPEFTSPWAGGLVTWVAAPLCRKCVGDRASRPSRPTPNQTLIGRDTGEPSDG